MIEVVDPLDMACRQCDPEPLMRPLGYVRTVADELNEFLVRENRSDIAARFDHGACLFDDAALGEGSQHPTRRLDMQRLAETSRALEQEREISEERQNQLAETTQAIARLTAEAERLVICIRFLRTPLCL